MSQWNTMQLKKKQLNHIICCNSDRTEKYVKGSKPEEEQTQNYTTYLWYIEKLGMQSSKKGFLDYAGPRVREGQKRKEIEGGVKRQIGSNKGKESRATAILVV